MPTAAAKTRSSRSEWVDDDAIDMAGLPHSWRTILVVAGWSGDASNFTDRPSTLTLPGTPACRPDRAAEEKTPAFTRIWGSKSGEIRVGALRRGNIRSPLFLAGQEKRNVITFQNEARRTGRPRRRNLGARSNALDQGQTPARPDAACESAPPACNAPLASNLSEKRRLR